MQSFIAELKLLVESNYPLVAVVTHEERRALRLMKNALSDHTGKLGIWSQTNMLQGKSSIQSPLAYLSTLKDAKPGVSILLDFHVFLNDGVVVRMLRDLTPGLMKQKHCLIMLGPVVHIPVELEKEIAVLELGLPTHDDLEKVFRKLCAKEKVLFPEDFNQNIIRAARGLTEDEALRVFTKALRKGGGFKLDDVSMIVEEKKRSVRKSEVLEYIEWQDNLDDVGGLEEVKDWVEERSSAFDLEARKYGLPAPKGLLLIGVQGCGKSLMAKAVAASWRLPLIRLDLGAVFGSANPEISMSRAMMVAESLAPVVLWVDEIEKGFSDVSGESGHHSSRVFGSFVTWLQEKQLPVFVVATANEIHRLPPELLRKGRFDETFFVDLPDVHERASILGIHLRKRGRDENEFDLETLARQSEHFSGAELEQGVLSGMYRAFGERREVTTRDISKELDQIVPLYTTYEERIKELREWAKTRARKANVDRSLVDLFNPE